MSSWAYFRALTVTPVALAWWRWLQHTRHDESSASTRGDICTHHHAGQHTAHHTGHHAGQLGTHDVGGLEDSAPIDTADHPVLYWERCADALVCVLENKNLMSDDELRRHIEAMEPHAYNTAPYYGRRAVSAAKTCLERGTFTQRELDEALGLVEERNDQSFTPLASGSYVRVRQEKTATRYVIVTM